MLRVADFAMMVLGAQADVMKRLGHLFGESVLLQILERRGEEASLQPEQGPLIPPQFLWIDPEASREERAINEAIAVQDVQISLAGLDLPDEFKFFLFQFSFYRSLTASPEGLSHGLDLSRAEVCLEIAEKMKNLGVNWLVELKLPAPYHQQALEQVEQVWDGFEDILLMQLKGGH